MIVKPKQNWLQLLFVWDGSVLQSIIPQLILMGLVSVLAVVTQGRIFGEKIPLNAALLTLFGLTLAIFIGFRNTASYDRFKEGRLLWGNALIAARSMMSQTLCYLPDPDARLQVADHLVACVYALKHELRGTDPKEDLVRLLGTGRVQEMCKQNYRPIAVLHALRQHMTRFNDSGDLTDARLWTLDAQFNELGKAVGGCERIASTPIPFAYSVLLHRTVYTYCMLLPFGLVDSTEFFTPLLCVFLSYTLIALEAIADEIADPFGLAPNALPLDSITRGIEGSVFELCGRVVPAPVPLKDGFLMT
jgi:putative membrane protein